MVARQFGNKFKSFAAKRVLALCMKLFGAFLAEDVPDSHKLQFALGRCPSPFILPLPLPIFLVCCFT